MPFPVNNIREVCKERKTSLAEVERALNIGNGVIARWENGKKYPPIDKIKAVADHLKVPVSRLTGEAENPPPVGDGLDAEFLQLMEKLTDQERDLVGAFAQGLLQNRKP